MVGGLLLLGITLWGAIYVVNHFRRPGAMTPIEAQGMQMDFAPPAGSAPVELVAVERGKIANTVRYSGQAIGYLEQDVAPRVTGTLVWMPFYAGDRVKRGQVLARLDTSQSTPQVANQRASLDMAQQGVAVARKEYQQTIAAIQEAHAEVGTRRGAFDGAKADLQAAQEERASANADLEAVQSMTTDATAGLQAAQADQAYWQQEIERERSLLKAGAVTQEEYQRELAQAENAAAKVRQAQARQTQVGAQIRAAGSRVRKAEAMVASARSKIEETQAELNAHSAHVRSSQAMADSARQKISQAQAGVAQANAGLAGASATQGYSEIRAETDGVIVQRVLSPGVLVTPGQTILRIAQVAPIRLQANVVEDDLARIHIGSAVLVRGRSETENPVEAKVTSVAPSIDPVARTGVIEAVVPNRDSRFLPGQYVTMEVSTGSRAAALRLPARALRYHTPPSGNVLSAKSMATVWVADPAAGGETEYTVREVPVQTGLSDGQNTEILSGLSAGQKVVLVGQDYLKSGDSVTPGTTGRAHAAPASPHAGHDSMPGMSNMSSPEPIRTAPPPQTAPPRTLYTCLMHPEVVLDHPGNCPKCGMRLVPKRGGTR